MWGKCCPSFPQKKRIKEGRGDGGGVDGDGAGFGVIFHGFSSLSISRNDFIIIGRNNLRIIYPFKHAHGIGIIVCMKYVRERTVCAGAVGVVDFDLEHGGNLLAFDGYIIA